MKLAKQCVDVGLNTNNLEPMLAFWQNEVGARFDHVLPIQSGMKQHRHDLNGSVLKINHYRAPLPPHPAAGYHEVIVAQAALAAPRSLTDPDGNRVRLVPAGALGIQQIAVVLHVRDLEAHHRFYAEALGLNRASAASGVAFHAGESLLICDRSDAAPTNASIEGQGWRYITFQVFKADEEHAHILAHGGKEAMAPRTLGTTARISMVRDPDGNWIEISQRASITGSLEP